MMYQCVQCRQELIVPSEGSGKIHCQQCGFEYLYAENYLKYDFDRLLFQHFKKKYLMNKVLNNNGYLSYHFLKETSVSLPGRPEALNFKKFILSQISYGKILDVGCGMLEIPGYLDFEKKEDFEIYGIDPIDDRSFKGMRVVGCGEFMPFQDNSFDAIIFATSLDHLCSIEHALMESYRILSNQGKVIVWMSDLRVPFLKKIKDKFGILLKSLREGYRIDRFIIYPNFTVLYVPEGAVDPFHIFVENPKEVAHRMRKAKFKMEDITYHNELEVFLCGAKRPSFS